MPKKQKKSKSPRPKSQDVPATKGSTPRRGRSRSRSSTPPAARSRAVPWVIQLLSYFNIFAPSSPADNRVNADLLLEVEENGQTSGRFRWVLSGNKQITASFKASDLIPGPREDDYDLLIVYRPQDIKLGVNMTSTKWMDLAELVAKGHVSVTLHGEEASHEFLSKFSLSNPNYIHKYACQH
jgi:hypothetical protein